MIRKPEARQVEGEGGSWSDSRWAQAPVFQAVTRGSGPCSCACPESSLHCSVIGLPSYCCPAPVVALVSGRGQRGQTLTELGPPRLMGTPPHLRLLPSGPPAPAPQGLAALQDSPVGPGVSPGPRGLFQNSAIRYLKAPGAGCFSASLRTGASCLLCRGWGWGALAAGFVVLRPVPILPGSAAGGCQW